MFKILKDDKYKNNKNYKPQLGYTVDWDDVDGSEMRVNIAIIDYKFLLPEFSGHSFEFLVNGMVNDGRKTSPKPDDYFTNYRIGLAKKLDEQNHINGIGHIELSSPVDRPLYGNQDDNFLYRQVFLQNTPAMTVKNYNDTFNNDSLSNEETPNIVEERLFVGKQALGKPYLMNNPAKTLMNAAERTINYYAYRSSHYHGYPFLFEANDEIEVTTGNADPKGAYLTFNAMAGPEGLFNAMMMASFEHCQGRLMGTDGADGIAENMRDIRGGSGVKLNPRANAQCYTK